MIKVVKIGGNVVDNDGMLESFCRDFAALEGPKILVHGGGVMASQLQKQLGQEPVMIEGRRVTDGQVLKVVTMVYAGWCNKHIVALLQKNGCNAIGLAGCDGSVIKARRRTPRKLEDGSTVDYGFVGDVTSDSVNVDFINNLLKSNIIPVLCAINHDGEGGLLNTNADTIASSVAIAMKANLLYLFEKKGVLYDRNDEDSVIPSINPEMFANLKAEGRIAEGMIPKINNSFAALRLGAQGVTIKHSSDLLRESGSVLKL